MYHVAAVASRNAHEWIAQVKLVARPRNGHVEEAPFLFFILHAIQGPRARKQAIAKHDHEYRIELKSFGLINCGEPDLFRVACRRTISLGLQVGEQSKLGQKIPRAFELQSEAGQLFEIFQPGSVIGSRFQ